MKTDTPAKNAKSHHSKSQEDRYFRIMRLVGEQPHVSQRELAEKVGISLGALNYCLKALIDKGFVKLENFQNSKHKSKYAYILTPKGITEKMSITGHFLNRKLQEYEVLQAEIDALKAEVGDNNLEIPKVQNV
jgi:EPS-associated MarR family transcriptional regulator